MAPLTVAALALAASLARALAPAATNGASAAHSCASVVSPRASSSVFASACASVSTPRFSARPSVVSRSLGASGAPPSFRPRRAQATGRWMSASVKKTQQSRPARWAASCDGGGSLAVATICATAAAAASSAVHPLGSARK